MARRLKHRLFFYDSDIAFPPIIGLEMGEINAWKRKLLLGISRHSWRNVSEMKDPTRNDFDFIRFSFTARGCHPTTELNALVFDSQCSALLQDFAKEDERMTSLKCLVVGEHLSPRKILSGIRSYGKFHFDGECQLLSWPASRISEVTEEILHPCWDCMKLQTAMRLIDLYDRWVDQPIFGDGGVWFFRNDLAALVGSHLGAEWRHVEL